MPELALDPDPAAVKLDQPLRDSEAETRAFALLCADAGLLELLEDPTLVFECDSRPGVGHGHEHLVVLARSCDHDAAAGGRELDRIREDVEDDLAESSLVASDVVDVRLELERKLDAVSDRSLAHHHDTTLEGLA